MNPSTAVFAYNPKALLHAVSVLHGLIQEEPSYL